MKEKDPIEEAIWAGSLALVKSLWGGQDYGYNRSAAGYVHEGDTTSVTLDTGKYQDDGTQLFYDIEIKVTKRISHGDSFWGPGGYIEKENIPARKIARIDGHHYVIEEDDNSGGFQGMGGRAFTIVFDDGREVVTRNLWSQGHVPPKWRERHPDNAHFKTAEKAAVSGSFSQLRDRDKSKISFTDLVELQCEYCADVNDRIIPVQDHCTCATPEIRDTEYMFQPEFENAED